MSVLSCRVCGKHICFVVEGKPEAVLGTCFECAAENIFGSPKESLQCPADAQNATQSAPDSKEVHSPVFGQQVAENRGRAVYFAGPCASCGKTAYTSFVPTPGRRILCMECWKRER